MARIRTVKPEFWSNEKVMACSRDARLLFIGIWNFADDAGRSPNSPKTMKAQIFPGDEDINSETVRRWLDDLSSNGLISFYEADGRSYLQIIGWNHQKIDKPRPSKYPEPFVEQSSNDRRGLATDLNYLNKPYPIKEPILEGSKKNEARSEVVKKPKHGAVSDDKRFVYFKIGTPEFEAYSKDFREVKGDEPQSTSDGRWFKWLGEQAGAA